MSSKDYLTRYFQLLGEVLAALMGFRDNGKHQLALDKIDQVLDAWFNLNKEQIEKSTSDELIMSIDDHSEKSIDKIKTIAELLYQKVITFNEMSKNEEAISLAEKALGLFQLIDKRSHSYSIQIQERIAALDQMVFKT